jgi:glucosyl-dolichyl phosphate glucuronosyltransferase
MRNIDISIIICTYNRGNMLKNVLENIKYQKFPNEKCTWEIILVDNNSNDNTKEIVEQYQKENKIQIKYLFEPQQGKSFALNTGVKASNGDLLAFTDDDVVIDLCWVSSIWEASNKYAYNCFGGKVLPIIETELPDWLSKDNKKYRIYGGPIVSHDRGDEIKEYDETMYVPIGSNMFIRRKVFDKYGYFNTRLGHYSKETLIYGEDSEIMFRFRSGGEKILYYPLALVYHPAPKERIKKSYFRKWCWGTGRGKARTLKMDSNMVRYYNIPRYMFKELLIELFRWIVVLFGHKEYKKFYHEMQILYKCAMMYEFYIEGE